jgi:predicted O-linked N-acetylglucosamine transferase (SPINDLY family)
MVQRSPIARMAFAALAASAGRLGAAGNRAGAIRLYGDWLRHNPRSPSAFAAHFNTGCLHQESGNLADSLIAYAACMRSNPQFVQARLNMGNVLDQLGRPDEAIAEWRKLVGAGTESGVDPALMRLALNNLGLILERSGRWGEAIAMLSRSLAIDPDQEQVIYHWVRLRQRICAWPIYGEVPGITIPQMVEKTSAVAMLSVSDDPALQLAAAKRNMAVFSAASLPNLSPPAPYGHARLRIGYLSSNFNLHAVSMLTAELFELHDRQRVEIFAFSWSPDDGSPMLSRIRAAMDHFLDIGKLPDEQAARAIRAAEIDVLVDLQGLTTHSRPRILAYRPAPCQVAYLGHPGTTAVPGVDYLLADAYLVPQAAAPYYAERVLHLPACYQVNDRQRPRPDAVSRAQAGLAPDAFVFCAFNNTNKFTPEVFASWMNILQRVPQAVLWLLADNPEAQTHLVRYAAAAGLDGSRLVMAPRAPYLEYLSRFPAADLFLDTFPFNGGVTTSDALWLGLPVLTRSGRSFASRMSGSLLHAIGLPELVTDSVDAYQDLAVALALDPARMARLRQTLRHNAQSCPLVDTPAFTRALEDVLLALVRNGPPATT